MNAMHKKIPTTDRPGAAEIAKWVLACFPSAVLVAFTLYPSEAFPFIAKLLDMLKF